MRRKEKITIVVIAITLIAVAKFYRLSDISQESIRFHLRLRWLQHLRVHEKTGRRRVRAEDLAQTSMPVRSPYWKMMIDSGTTVIVWHDDLKDNSAENASTGDGMILILVTLQ